jgi:hypothetical protein
MERGIHSAAPTVSSEPHFLETKWLDHVRFGIRDPRQEQGVLLQAEKENLRSVTN